MLKIAKERLNELYAKIDETMGLFIPIKRAGEVNYAVWGEGKEVSLETLKTVKSPKNAFAIKLNTPKLLPILSRLKTSNSSFSKLPPLPNKMQK